MPQNSCSARKLAHGKEVRSVCGDISVELAAPRCWQAARFAPCLPTHWRRLSRNRHHLIVRLIHLRYGARLTLSLHIAMQSVHLDQIVLLSFDMLVSLMLTRSTACFAGVRTPLGQRDCRQQEGTT